MTEPSHAIFLSYASQDAEAARRICEALRAAGIEVWFDQSELRGGDAWDQSIRKQIKTCALFLPVISRSTRARDEGYFRLEWKLAIDRCHLMAADKAFLLPVVVDDTSDDDERVPERFRDVQWTRLPDGVTSAAFVQRVRGLLSGQPPTGPRRDCRRPGICSTDKLKTRADIPVAEGDACGGDRRGDRRTRLPRDEPNRAVEAWRRRWSGSTSCGSKRSSRRLHTTAALDRGITIREHER